MDHTRGGPSRWRMHPYVDNACIMNLDKDPSVQMIPKENVQKDIYIYIVYNTYIYIPWKSKDHILPFGSTESFLWIILVTVRLAWSQTSGVTLFP